eukprot:600290-Lingulodinium_polyedra.AAC.1
MDAVVEGRASQSRSVASGSPAMGQSIGMGTIVESRASQPHTVALGSSVAVALGSSVTVNRNAGGNPTQTTGAPGTSTTGQGFEMGTVAESSALQPHTVASGSSAIGPGL